MKRRLIALFMAFAMCLTLLPTAYAGTSDETDEEDAVVDEATDDSIADSEDSEDSEDSDDSDDSEDIEVDPDIGEVYTEESVNADNDADALSDDVDAIDMSLEEGYKEEEPSIEILDEITVSVVADTDLASSNVASGTLDGGLTWTLSSSYVLTISGSGAMPDFSYYSYQPWRSYNSYITKIVVSSGVTYIGKYAFTYCTNATSVSLPSGLTEIAHCAFSECTGLKEVTIPDTVTTIGYAAFADCYDLTSIDLGTGVTTIEEYAFQSTAITSLTLPASLTSFTGLCVFKCTDLTAFTVTSGNTSFKTSSGILFNKKKTELVAYPAAKTATSYTIPSTVTSIGDGAFLYATNLQSISFDECSVTYLGKSAFQGSGLTSVTIPDSVTEVGMYTFCKCTSLKKVKFGSGLTETSFEMFEECTALTSISFGSALTSVGMRSFGNCTALTSIKLNSGLKQICSYAFYGCTSLTSVTFPSSITLIEYYAFGDLDITMPSTLTEMDDGSYRLVDSVTISGTCKYDEAYAVLEIVNEERAEQGLDALTMDKELLAAAMQRAAEINLYYSHTRPTGMSCGTVSSKVNGENIAVGYSSASSVMIGWMNSAGHKANILTSDYTSIGIGCFTQGGYTYWVQLFSCDEAKTVSQPSNKTKSFTVYISPDAEDWAMEIYLSNGSGSFYSNLNTVSVNGSRYIEAYIINPNWSTYCKIDASSLTWKSASKSYVTVSSAGKLTGVSEGSSVISATTSGGTLSASKKIKAITTVKPTIASASITSSGIKLTWDAFTNDGVSATKYYIYRKAEGESSYTKVKTTTSTSWTDKSVENGTKYTYKIKALMKDESTTSYSSAKSKVYLKLSTVSNTTSGVKLSWSKVTGATKYEIYRKVSGGSYTKIKTTTSASYTDTTAKKGTTYYYKVKAIKSDGSTIVTSVASNIRRMGKTTVTLKNTTSGVKVSWTKVTGASGYYIYRKTSSGSYSKIKTITSASTLSYTDKKVASKNGTTYIYKIVPYYENSSGSVSSTGVAATKTTVRLTGTTLTSVKNSASKKITAKWSAVSKVTGYQIRYSTKKDFSSNNVTVTVKGATSASEVISSLTKNKTYYVQIRTYKTVSGTRYYSAWSSKLSVKISK